MGPNGSGKSTFASVLLGNPGYEVTGGAIRLNGEDVTLLAPDARAKLGMFLAFQDPEEVPGVPVSQFLRQAAGAGAGATRTSRCSRSAFRSGSGSSDSAWTSDSRSAT